MAPISRRMFLVATAGVAVAACSGDSDGETSGPTSTPTSTPMSTPESTTSIQPSVPVATDTDSVAGTASSVADSMPDEMPDEMPDATVIQQLDLPGDPFTLGVASGDPDATSVVLWTRLAPSPLDGGGMPPGDVEVIWELSIDEAFETTIASGGVVATDDHAHTVHAIAAPPAGTSGRMWYRFRAGQFVSPVGSTMLAPSAAVSTATFVSASCQDYQDGFYAAHRDIAEQQPDFLLWLGDYIYEGGAATVGDGAAVRTHGTAEPTDLAGYRDRYALYKSDPDLQAAHRACPWFVIWDDHEVENNYAGDVPQDSVDQAGFSARRHAAYVAWWEHQPVRLDPPAETGEYRIYRDATWGDLLGISLLDTRQYRTDQACGDRTLNLDPPCPETFDDDRTLTGDTQQRWIEETVGSHGAVWNVIAQQLVMSDLTLNGAVLNYDQWDGYPKNRQQILSHLAEAAVPNAIVLSGDIHLAGVGMLRAGEPGIGQPVAIEFVDTSISSSGLIDPAVTDVVRTFPDIVDVELSMRGYTLHTVTPQTWTAAYRSVRSAQDQQSPVTTYKTFVVDAGTTAVRETT